MKCKLILFLFSVLFISGLKAQILDSAQGEDGNSGILYGDNHVYSLTAPKGWILDNRAGVSQGLHAVFYKTGSSWETGTTVMYTNYSTSALGETVENTIEFDKNNFTKNYPGIEIKKEKDLIIDKGKLKAQTYSYQGANYNNYEAVAYIPTKSGVALVVITSRDKKDFDLNYLAFEKLVESFFWMTDKIEINK